MLTSSPKLKVDLEGLRKIYDRVGGTKKLRQILQDFYHEMSKDILIGFFFEGKNLDDIAENQLGFFLKGIGVNTHYSGKAPADAHEQLPPILSGHFDRRLRILEKTLTEHQLREDEIETWINFEKAFREGIVKN